MIFKILITTLKIYQKIISPIIISNCRFYPTCSQFSIEMIKKFGIINGIYLSLNRLAKCHPLNIFFK